MGTFFGQMPVKLAGAVAGTGLTATTVANKFVKLSADNTVVLCSAATDVPIGVLQAPAIATGDAVEVVVIGETQVQADAALTAGQLIGTSADGQAAHYTPGSSTTNYIVGAVVSAEGGASNAGNLVTAVINCATPARAA
jgi:hypothetical protein